MHRALAILVAALAVVSAYLVWPLGGGSNGAWAGEATVALSVPGMTCAACPITVGKSLRNVDGVSLVDVSFEELKAVVTYDPDKSSVAELIAATTNVGYPSTLIEQ